MKYTLCLFFIIPLILWACQSPRSDVPTQSVPSPLSETESVMVIQSASLTPFPTTILTTTPSQTPLPLASPTLPPSLSSLRVVYSDGKNVWRWQNSLDTPLTTIEGYSDLRLSDDGKLVAFKRDGLLWVINSDGTGERLLVSTENLETIEPATK